MPSIKDVAIKAGVSVTTVSRVINNRGYIGKQTRKKVEQAMAEIDYQPNLIARSLQRNQSFLLGVIVPDSNHPFFSELIKYIEMYATELNYKILICNSLDSPSKEQQYISMLRQNRVDGIIMCSHTLNIQDYQKVDLPIVSFDRIISNKFPYVGSDNFRGGEIAAEHLISKGCKSLLYLSGPLDVDLLPNRRWDAFRVKCLNANVSFDVIECRDNQLNFDSLSTFINNEVLDRIHDFDGVFCNDTAAYALYIQATEKGIEVPEQLKIVGYDYHSFTRMLQHPKLTTIKQPIDRIGKTLSSTIIKMVENKDEETTNNTIMDVELIQGNTT